MHDPLPPTMHWGTEALWHQLVPLLPGLSVEVVHTARSTNTTLLERARAVPDTSPGRLDAIVRASVESAAFGRRAADLQPCLLVAEQQTAGRGRQGRAWHASLGASLTFSLGLPLAMSDWSGLSLAVGVGIAEALDPGGHRVGLKWPNDLWLLEDPPTTRKLGGILIETVSAGSQRLAIIGVGLNVQQFEPVGDVTTGFAPLDEVDGAASTSPPAVLARIALPLVKAVKQFEREGFAPFVERYAARDVLRDRSVTTTLGEVSQGIARGISPKGELLVETGDGRVHRVASGEVSVRLARTA